MNIAVLFELLKKFLLMIFERFDVLKEFDALGVDVGYLLESISLPGKEE